MTISSVGDLSKSYQLRRDTTRIKSDLVRLTSELSSGVSNDLVGKLKGNFAPLSGIERGLARMESFKSVIAEQRLVTSSVQLTLGSLRTLGDNFGTLLTVPDTSDPTLVRNAGTDALLRFSSAVSDLNIQVGGRTIFSGVQTDRPALAEPETILVALESEIALAGAATAVDVEAVVTAWFETGGGFDTLGYTGGPAIATGQQLSDSETAPPQVTSERGEIRDYLAAMAMAGLIGRDVLAGVGDEQGELARLAGQRLLAADNGLVNLQSEVGAVEQQVERANVEVATEKDSLTIARSELIEIDPFEAAVGLQNAETQLQTLYSITARLSGLTLAQYL